MLVSMILAVAATLGALLYVARPFFGEAESPLAARADPLASGRFEVVEERDRALAALRELEFDHRTGKVSDDDYRELVGPLRKRAVETLRSLEPVPPPERSARSRPGRRPRATVRA